MTRHRRLSAWMAAGLVVAGTGLAALRLSTREGSRVLEGDGVWRLEYDITLASTKEDQRAQVSVPVDTGRIRVFRREIEHAGALGQLVRARGSPERILSLVLPEDTPLHLHCEFDLHLQTGPLRGPDWKETPASADVLEGNLHAEPQIQVSAASVRSILRILKSRPGSRRDLLEAIFRHCSDRIIYGVGDEERQDADGVLARRSGTVLGGARAMVALCRASRIPARLVSGFILGEEDAPTPRPWVEAYLEDRWLPFDPEAGYAIDLPSTYLPVRYGGTRLARGGDRRSLRVTYTLLTIPAPPELQANSRRDPLEILDLTRLPLELRLALAQLLLLPVGALITALFRNVVGIRTFGIFSPALIALSFVTGDGRLGSLVLLLVVVFGFIGRRLLERLKLLLIPRLGIVLTLIVGGSALLVSAIDFLGLAPPGQSVLLPIVIITMVVERAYVITEEDGGIFPLTLAAGTLVVAGACYSVMRWEWLAGWLVTCPELHLVTVGLLTALGRYSGYRISELWRFRAFWQGGA